MKFKDYRIADDIKRSIDKLGFSKPTDIQFKAIPPILRGDDLFAIAQTGSGKTAAFVIPLLNLFVTRGQAARGRSIGCLVMAPTRELAIQIDEVFKQIGKYTKVKSLAIYGGSDQDPQIDQLKKGVDILIATPGRLFDLSAQGHLILEDVKYLVLDEADRMLDMGFLPDIQQIARKLARKRQTLFFSATIDDKIKKLAYSLVTDPIHIKIAPKNRVATTIDHSVVRVEMDDKRFFLERVIKENSDKKILVFARTKVRVGRVVKAMERAELKCSQIHGNLSQDERSRVLDEFKESGAAVMVATDVTARGIDIPNVDIVVNYDIPDDVENYVHRVGRTGRAGAKGLAVSFLSKEEDDKLADIQDYLGTQIAMHKFSRLEYDQTINLSSSASTDWKSVMDEIEQFKEVSKEIARKKLKRKAQKKKKR